MMESIDFRSYTPADLTSCAVGLAETYKHARRFILTDSQKMGMGKCLMTYVSRELKHEHINRLFLMTGSSEVIPFYQKIGFSFNIESTMMTLDLT
ncbi:GNAT family N-acetyltransferase [Enterococcus bulliens]